MKTFITSFLFVFFFFSTNAQVNYSESASGDLSATPGSPDFTVGAGLNQWTGLIEATEPAQADLWDVIVPCGFQVTTVTYTRSGGDPATFGFNSCSNGLFTTSNNFSHTYDPPLGPGTYCVEIITDFNANADPWTVTVAVQFVDVDTDNDGTFDCIDQCDSDPNKIEPGECGCGNPEIPGCGSDACPDDPNKIAPGICGCGVADTDSDGDGTADCNDACPADPGKIAPGICGCGVADTDSDGDGTADCNDACPTDPGKITPGICGCGVADTDSDGDGTADCNDACPADPGKIAPGICGCGVADTDSDGDGTADCNDACPTDPGKITPGICGCGVADTDSDGDGTADCNDACPTDPGKIAPGVCGCGVADTDSDGDGTADCNDGCPNDANKTAPGQCGCGNLETDSDSDGIADCVDTDDDNDGVADADDLEPLNQFICRDADGDGCDDCSNGSDDITNDGTDTDGDGLCDVGDPDDDNDGQLDVDEIACGSDPLNAASTSPDNDGDNSPDCVDSDDDNDGVLDADDNCPFDANPGQEDLDQDNIGDICDPVVNVDGAIGTLEELIVNLSVKHGLENAFTVKINNANSACSNGDSEEAMDLLNAFINQVEAKRGKDLTDSEADDLIAIAQIIIDAISSGDSDCGASSLEKSNQSTDLFDDLQINVFPNPASYETVINFNLSKTQNVSLQLINVSGQRIQQIDAREFYKGPQQIKFQTKDLENGIYFIVIKTPNSISSKKISIIK